MVRRWTAFGAGACVVLFTSVSGAQGRGSLGEKGQFIFSADRLFPLVAYTNSKTTDDQVNPNQTHSTSGSSISLFYGNNSTAIAGNPTFYTVPRLGFDYTVIPNLTVGGDLFLFFTLGGTTTSHCTGSMCTNDQKGPSGSAWGLAPRVGYILGLTNLLSVWLRGGVSYYHATSSIDVTRCNRTDSDSEGTGVFGIDLDPQLVFSPVNHFAFELGPAIDWGFAGNTWTESPDAQMCGTTTTTSVGYTSVHVGVTGGLFGWF